MSYSFNFRAANPAAADTLAAEKFAEVVASQPIHERDRDVALATVKAVSALVGDVVEETHELSVSVSGWVSWSEASEPKVLTGANVSVSVSVVPKAN